MNLGSYHPINKLSVIWNCDSETDAETGCASLIFFTPPAFVLQLPLTKEYVQKSWEIRPGINFGSGAQHLTIGSDSSQPARWHFMLTRQQTLRLY